MFLGLDFGTSSVKALLVDGMQTVIGSATMPLTAQRPAAGHSEQDPEAWWHAMLDAVDALGREHKAALAAVQGIGLSGQMHGAVLLDAGGAGATPGDPVGTMSAPAPNVPSWRAAPADPAADHGQHCHAGLYRTQAALGPHARAGCVRRTRTVLLPKAWLRYRMTGEMIEEMSDASGTLWLDVGARDWSDAALAATGYRAPRCRGWWRGMPRLARSAPTLPHDGGMARPPILAGGAGDNAGRSHWALRHPARRRFHLAGDVRGCCSRPRTGFRPYPQAAVHAFCHAIPNTRHQMGVTLSAADSLSWWAGVAGRPEAELLAEMGAPSAPSRHCSCRIWGVSGRRITMGRSVPRSPGCRTKPAGPG